MCGGKPFFLPIPVQLYQVFGVAFLTFSEGVGPCGGDGEGECGEGAGCAYVAGQVNPICVCPDGTVGNGYDECEGEIAIETHDQFLVTFN